jgi:hypothetical protein
MAPIDESRILRRRCDFVASHNNVGLETQLGGVIRVGHSVVSGNNKAVAVQDGTIFSYGDNDIDGNTINAVGLTPLAMH